MIVGPMDVILMRNNLEAGRRAIQLLLPGAKVMFELPRFGLTRRVRTDLNCSGCFDLQESASNWSDPLYKVETPPRNVP